jgi:hypothetical protein
MENVFEVSSAQALYDDMDKVRATIDERGYAIARGLVSKDDVAKFRGRVTELYDPTADVRISGAYQRGSRNFQRLDLGEYPSSSRFARYFFFFSWNDDRDFADIGRVQMTIFNKLTRQPDNFGFDGDDDDDRFRVSFVIQYPIGGGFMSKHREYSTKGDDKAYVVYLALTTRGVDYQAGGAYIDVAGETVDIEANVRAGDVVFYRGDMFHGVYGVDRDKPVQMGEVCGRMILTTQANYFKAKKPKQ